MAEPCKISLSKAKDQPLYRQLTMVVRFNASIRQDLTIPMAEALAKSRTVASPDPLYGAHEVETVLKSFKPSVELWTTDCQEDVYWKLGWSHEEVQVLIAEAVRSGRLISSEWCEQKPDGPLAPCDAYEVLRPKGSPKKLYVKFAIARNGMKLLVVSCHKSEPGKKARKS